MILLSRAGGFFGGRVLEEERVKSRGKEEVEG